MNERVDLDEIREQALAWLISLWEEKDGCGAFRLSRRRPANLLSATDAAWLAYCLDGLPALASFRPGWIKWLQAKQNPDTGEVVHDPDPNGGYVHVRGHAFWHTIRALNILGAQLNTFPRYLRPVLTSAGLHAWFAANPRGNCHETLGLVPILASQNDAQWIEGFYAELGRQQDPVSGLWAGESDQMSHNFAFTALHCAVGRLPAHLDKIIKLARDFSQNAPFGTDGSCPGFKTMDATYMLVRLPRLAKQGQAEAQSALSKMACRFIDFFKNDWPAWDQRDNDTHRLLANLHTLGLLAEAFPEWFHCTRQWRFDWDRTEMYRCELIVRELESA